MELAKNQIIDIKITDMSADGNGIGRYENIAIFTQIDYSTAERKMIY